MMKTEPKVDQYIENAAPFAQPILRHLRELVHRTCPEVEEKIRWGFPHFDYKGLLVSMAAFKQHCAFTFWKGDLLNDPEGMLKRSPNSGMGHLGKIRQLSDLPGDKDLEGFIREAMHLNELGIKGK